VTTPTELVVYAAARHARSVIVIRVAVPLRGERNIEQKPARRGLGNVPFGAPPEATFVRS